MKLEDVGSIPVIESQNSKKLVGIVTDRDIVLKVVTDRRYGQDTTVEAVMTRDPVTCRKDENLDKALKKMADHQVRRIPVVNGGDEIVGIIAQADIATRTEEPTKTAEVVEEISKAVTL
jgi:CBS domain-containing protein